mgnify:CR=1 FL=1
MGANASEDCLIQINGGVVTINAGGDAVDSNGYVEVTGGELVGASSGAGDSALDYEYGATVTGGHGHSGPEASAWPRRFRKGAPSPSPW